MAQRLRQDFQSGTVTDAPLTSGATTINSAEFADLLEVSGTDILVLVLDPHGDSGDPEIVHVTAHSASATSATISRAQEGTAAREHALGTTWQHNATAEDFDTKLTLKSITSIAQGTTTYTLPEGITTIFVECIGAGGGGGGAATAASQAAVGSGGGGGGYASKLITNPASSYTVQVGAGGAGGADTGGVGSSGTDTTFGSPSVCTATAGGGGGGMTAGTTAASAGIGAPGAGTVGDVLLEAHPAQLAFRASGTVGFAGSGGSAPRGGGGGRGRASAGAAFAGGNYGGGGAGGSVLNGSSPAVVGGAGANGRIIVYEYGP